MFYYMNPTVPRAYEVFLSSLIFLNFFYVLKLYYISRSLAWLDLLKVYFEAIVKCISALISFSFLLSFVYRKSTRFHKWILFSDLLEAFICGKIFMVQILEFLMYKCLPFPVISPWSPSAVLLVWIRLQVLYWLGI